ncbi:acid protease [Atractiella rhizophila]|nr:acid protease [Atractiella rhizophila]
MRRRSDLWVPDSSCVQTFPSICTTGVNVFNRNASSTLQQVNSQVLNISYGDGSGVQGAAFTETVAIGTAVIQNQFFSPVTSFNTGSLGSSGLLNGRDGLLGLAFETISQLNQRTPSVNAFLQGQIQQPLFGVRLGDPDQTSELFLGGINNALLTGSIESYEVINPAFWLLGAFQTLSAKPFGNCTTAAIDTGTTLIVAPIDEAILLYSQIPGATTQPDQSGAFYVPCDTIETVQFGLKFAYTLQGLISNGADPTNSQTFGRNWGVAGKYFNFGMTSPGSNMCVGAVIGSAAFQGQWIVGDAFIQNNYNIYNFANVTVSFADTETGDPFAGSGTTTPPASTAIPTAPSASVSTSATATTSP